MLYDITIRDPQNPILIMKAPTLYRCQESFSLAQPWKLIVSGGGGGPGAMIGHSRRGVLPGI